MADSGNTPEKRRKGTRAGVLMIVLGVLSSFVVYYMDSTSLDFSRMMNAKDFAILHAVLWGFAGLFVILWANREPPEDANNYDSNDPYR
jgi:hypothetical protein